MILEKCKNLLSPDIHVVDMPFTTSHDNVLNPVLKAVSFVDSQEQSSLSSSVKEAVPMGNESVKGHRIL